MFAQVNQTAVTIRDAADNVRSFSNYIPDDRIQHHAYHLTICAPFSMNNRDCFVNSKVLRQVDDKLK